MARYLVIVEVHAATPERLARFVPRLQEVLASLSKATPELAFRSIGADIFGYCIASDMKAAQIRACIETPARDTNNLASPILDGADKLLVLELGDDCKAGKGFTRIGTWLEHHH